MLQGDALTAALEKAATIAFEAVLVRKVPFFALIRERPMQFLFSSGKPNRFNLEGTNCLYLSEDERTALAEWTQPLAGFGKFAPYTTTTFFARVRVGTALDVCNSKIREALRLSEREIFANWRTAARYAETQELGETVARKTNIVAIRFPSYAAKRDNFSGVNLVIFKDKIVSPDTVEVFDEYQNVVEKLPPQIRAKAME
jgi:RES domain-containing protein